MIIMLTVASSLTIGMIYARFTAKASWRSIAAKAAREDYDEGYARRLHRMDLVQRVVLWWGFLSLAGLDCLGRWVSGPVERERNEIAKLRQGAAHWRTLAADPALATSEAARADLEGVAADYDRQANERAVALGVVPDPGPPAGSTEYQDMLENIRRLETSLEQQQRATQAAMVEADKARKTAALVARHELGCRCSLCAAQRIQARQYLPATTTYVVPAGSDAHRHFAHIDHADGCPCPTCTEK